MNITKNGITIVIDDAEITRMALERLNGSAYPATLRGISVPRIGQVWPGMGGIYAGIGRGFEGAPDYHGIVGPEFDGKADWDTVMQWSTGLIVEGHRDFALLMPAQGALCFANVPELFKQEIYWLGKQLASGSGYAWSQHFADGGQDSWHKGDHGRARAVRSIPIQ